MRKENNTTEFQKIEGAMIEFLDTLGRTDRLETIDDLFHRLNFERRLTALTKEERAHMQNATLSDKAEAALKKAETPAKREESIVMYARSIYFKRCAWVDYLNGGRTEKPFDSAGKK